MPATATSTDPARVAPSPAVAPPPGNPRFALFDSLRGIAALAIVSYHVFSLTGAFSRWGIGDLIAVLGPRSLLLFFVISGFLLYRPFVAARAQGRPPPSIARYGRRRVLRIVPGYWFALTALAIFPGIVGPFGEHWWRYYLFLQLYSHETLIHGLPVAWSLSVEVTYYLALPLWVLAVRRIGRGPGERAWLRAELGALAAAAAVGVVFQVLGARQVVSEPVAQSLLGQSTWLALGMALAVASVAAGRGPGRSRAARFVVEHPGLCWAGAIAALVGLAVLLHPSGIQGIIGALATKQPVVQSLAAVALTAAMCGLLVAPAVFGEDAGGWPRRLLAARPVAWLGLISYGIFLWHLPIAQFLGLAHDPAHFSATGLNLIAHIPQATTPILMGAVLVATCVAAAVSYHVVELPFLRLKEGRR